MATIRHFEEIEAWRKSRELTRAIYRITKTGRFAKDYELRGQIRKAAISVMSNIAEGFDREGTVEFLQFLSIAKGSVGEVESQLFIALDEEYIGEQEFRELRSLTDATRRLTVGFMSYLRRSGIRGQKYKALPATESASH